MKQKQQSSNIRNKFYHFIKETLKLYLSDYYIKVIQSLIEIFSKKLNIAHRQTPYFVIRSEVNDHVIDAADSP